MALFTGRVLLRDAHGLGTTKTVKIDVDEVIHVTPTEQIVAAKGRLEAFVNALDAIVDAVIETVALTVDSHPGGLKTVPGDQSVSEGANLVIATVDNDANPQLRPYWLPSALADIFNPNFRTINTAAQDLVDWLATFNAAGVDITISDGETVESVESGVYASRRRTAD